MHQLKINQPAIDNNRAQEIEQYKATVGGYEIMPDSTELSAIIKAVREGDEAATAKSKRIWLRTIIDIATQCAPSTHLPFDALVAAGMEGLLKFIHNSPDEDKFFSFYVWNIKQGILGRIKENSDNIA